MYAEQTKTIPKLLSHEIASLTQKLVKPSIIETWAKPKLGMLDYLWKARVGVFSKILNLRSVGFDLTKVVGFAPGLRQ